MLLAACLLAGARAVTFVNLHEGGTPFGQFNPKFVAPLLTPPQFLMISSEREQKVNYAPLRNFKAVTGRTYTLIDSGLVAPRGIAFDRENGALYVADHGAQKIFRYHVYVTDGEDPVNMRLYSDHVQITILTGVPVSWVTVDRSGDVFYSDPNKKAICRIPLETINTLATGAYAAVNLNFVPEAKLIQEAMNLRKQDMNGTSDPTPTDRPAVSVNVQEIYQGSQNTHVAAPGGVTTDGLHIYWTNTDNGTSFGSVVRGMRDPQLQGYGSNATFPTSALTNFTDQAIGVAKATTMIVYGTDDNGVGKIFGVMEKSGELGLLSQEFGSPRGLVWDGDQTVYVADPIRNGVWSLPVGRLANNEPIQKAAVLDGAYGLALLSKKDKAWYITPSGAQGLRGAGRLGGLMALLAAWLASTHWGR